MSGERDDELRRVHRRTRLTCAAIVLALIVGALVIVEALVWLARSVDLS